LIFIKTCLPISVQVKIIQNAKILRSELTSICSSISSGTG